MKNVYAELAFSFKTVKLFKQNYYLLNNESVTAGSLVLYLIKLRKSSKLVLGVQFEFHNTFDHTN